MQIDFRKTKILFSMVPEITMGYGRRLEKLRVHLGLSITDFAEKADVAGSSMSLILREVTRNPSIGVFVSLSKSLNASLSWMAFGNGPMLLDEDVEDKQIDVNVNTLQQMQSRIEELKEQVGNLKYVVTLQQQLLEHTNGVKMGKHKGAIIDGPLSTEAFDVMMEEYRASVLGQSRNSSFFLAPQVAKLVAPRLR